MKSAQGQNAVNMDRENWWHMWRHLDFQEDRLIPTMLSVFTFRWLAEVAVSGCKYEKKGAEFSKQDVTKQYHTWCLVWDVGRWQLAGRANDWGHYGKWGPISNTSPQSEVSIEYTVHAWGTTRARWLASGQVLTIFAFKFLWMQLYNMILGRLLD